MYGAFGVLAALHERAPTGRGRVVRTSLLAGMVGVHAFQGTRWTVAGEVPGLAGDHHPAIAPYGMFATGTAPIQIACGSEGLWRALCAALGCGPADERFATNPQRVEHRDELIALLEAHFATGPPSTGCAAGRAGVPSGKVRSRRRLLVVDHPTQVLLSAGARVLRRSTTRTLGTIDAPRPAAVVVDDDSCDPCRPHDACRPEPSLRATSHRGRIISPAPRPVRLDVGSRQPRPGGAGPFPADGPRREPRLV